MSSQNPVLFPFCSSCFHVLNDIHNIVKSITGTTNRGAFLSKYNMRSYTCMYTYITMSTVKRMVIDFDNNEVMIVVFYGHMD